MPLSAKQERIALAIAAGQRVVEATALGVSERSIRRWLAKDGAFRQRVEELRAEMFSAAVGQIAQLSGRAAATMGELLHSDSESIRLAAAKSILEHCPKTLENAPVVAQAPALQDYGALALADPIAAGLVVQLLSRAADRGVRGAAQMRRNGGLGKNEAHVVFRQSVCNADGGAVR
jgi:hypothetical protein